MSTDLYRKCAKCGITPNDNLSTFHRFPKPGKTNILRAKAWATYCCPEQESWSLESLKKLFSSNKVLCKRHFEDSCFTDSTKTRLSKFSVPGEKQYVAELMAKLRRVETEKLEQSELKSGASAVTGCYTPGNDHVTMHSFANPEKDPVRFHSWLYAIGGDILAMDNENIYKKGRVCHKHFETKYHTWTKTLSPNAVPTLHLPVAGPKLHGYSRKGDFDHTYYKAEESTSKDGQSTSQGVPPIKHLTSQIDKNGQSISQKVPSSKRLTGQIGKNVFKTTEEYDTVQTLSLSQYIQNVSQGTDYQLDDGGIMEDDQSAEVPEALQEEVPFSWQQPSAVVPSDEEMYEIDAGSAVDLEQELHDAPDQPLEKGDYRCDVCSGSIVGFRYTCVQCADYDICGSCEARGAHPLHYVLRVPGQRPHAEVQAALLQIRRALLADAIVQFTTDKNVEVKEEPSADVEDPIEVPPSVEQPTEDSIVEDRTAESSCDVESTCSAEYLEALESSFEEECEEIPEPTVCDAESSDADLSDDNSNTEREHTAKATLNVVRMPQKTTQTTELVAKKRPPDTVTTAGSSQHMKKRIVVQPNATLNVVRMPLMKTQTTKLVAKRRPPDTVTTSRPQRMKKRIVVQPNVLETSQRSLQVRLRKLTAADIKALHES